jgi:colanic acid/amylovoran biosynthesis glycosyltransferase
LPEWFPYSKFKYQCGKTTNMKVVHFCRTFSKLSETFIYDTITELANTDINNKVVTFRRENIRDRPFADVALLASSWSQSLVKGMMKFFGMIRLRPYNHHKELGSIRGKMLHQYLRQEQPDVVQAHFGSQGMMIQPETSSLGIPLVVSFHGYDAFRLPHDPVSLAKMHKLFEQAAAITVVSTFMKNHLASLGCQLSKIHLIHVGKRLSDYPFKAAITTPVRKFVTIGRLCEKKGFLDCIAAFSLLVKNYPDLKLNIVGSGELHDEITSLIKTTGLGNHVFLLGSLPHEEVIKTLQEADALILCSKTSADGNKEGIPAVLMEAQAIGLPCISTLHSGIPEIFPEVCKFLLAKEADVEDIADKIETLINAPKLQIEQLANAGRAMIESQFNLVEETRKLYELYHAVLKG